MAKTINIVFIVIFSLFLTACGGGVGGVVNDNETIINGKVVDNYIAGATVCIDANFNNICDPGEISTKTNDKGEFTLKSSADLNDSVVVIAYDGNDTNTNEPFNFIVKNIVTNQDKNSSLNLSSLNTLVTEYKILSNETLNESKVKIANFLGSDIDQVKMIEDIVANRVTAPNEFLRSLKIFQMVGALNDVNNSINSAKSFNAIAKAIRDDINLKHYDSNITVLLDGVEKNIGNFVSTPVFIDIPTPNVAYGTKDILTISELGNYVINPDGGVLNYSIGGTNSGLFEIVNGKILFKNPPNQSSGSEVEIILNATCSSLGVSKTVSYPIAIGLFFDIARVPYFTSANNFFVDENQQTFIDIDATDIDGANLFFSLGGIDKDYFDIDSTTGVVVFKTPPNYETKNLYNITATVNDGVSDAIQNITIRVNNLNEYEPFFASSLSTATVDENQLNVIDINGTDDDGNNTILYGIKIGSGDFSFFNIDSMSGVVTFKTPPNYETKNLYIFTATISDGVTTKEKIYTIYIRNINEFAPYFISANNYDVLENQTNALVLNATDSDGDTLVYTISGADVDYFDINGSNITFKHPPDFESLKRVYNIGATASDGEHNTTQNITINLLNVNDNVPIFTSLNNTAVDENQTFAIDINGTDSDGNNTVTYSISGADASLFDIDTSTGIVTFKVPPDYETKTSYSFVARLSDGINNIEETITININNLNDNSPIFTSSANQYVDENQTQAMIVNATDDDNLGSLIYSISDGDATLFDINSSTGVVTFKNAELDNDYEKAHFYTFKVTASDGNHIVEQNITLHINSINLNAPQITSSNSVTINENQQFVIDIEATDIDNMDLNYTISGTNSNLFDINRSTGVVTFKDINSSDYEIAHSYLFSVSVTDGIYVVSQNISVNLTNLNDNPPVLTIDSNISINENQLNVINGSYVTDKDSNLTALTYSISDDNSSLFDINSSSGSISFKNINSSDYEAYSTYKFKISVSDGDFTVDKNITINLTNLNDNLPIFTSSNNLSVDENQTFAIDINGSDGDDDNLTFSLVGSLNDANSFDINSSTGVVTFKVPPDYESGKISYSFTARIGDGLNDIDQNVTLSINNLNDNSPIFISSSEQSFNENNSSAMIVLSATDLDNLSSIIYSISGGDANDFNISSSTGIVTFKVPPDHETKSLYTFIAQASDGEHNSTQFVTVDIKNIDEVGNDSPTGLQLSQNTIVENNVLGVKVGDLNSTDIDSTVFTYSLVNGAGDTDNNLFSIEGNVLKIGVATNYETKSSYNIRVQTKDDQNAIFEKAFVIYISDMNEAPVITTSNYGNFDQSTNLVTPSLVVNDPDVGDNHRFTFSSNPNLGSLNINTTTGALSGLVGDVGVGTHIIQVRVADKNGTGADFLSSDKNISLTINEINDKPIANNYDSNITVEAGVPYLFTVDGIGDGDIYLFQNVVLDTNSIENNNSGIVSIVPVDTDGSDGNIKLSFVYLKSGKTTVKFKLKDDGLPIEDREIIVNILARGTGWNIYEEQKASNYTNSSVDFDGINYLWSSENRWYATSNTILLPIRNVAVNNQGANVTKYIDGHYVVFKNNYMNALRVGDGNLHTANNYYESADGNISGIKAVDRNFQHDKNHHVFVSTIIYDNSNFKSFPYNNGWIKEASSIYLNANDTNRTFGTDINLSMGYALASQQIDSNNDGNDICADYYGLGWRLPTAYEMGININSNQTNSYKFGYIPSYVGIDSSLKIISSTYGSYTSGWVLGNGTGESAGDLFTKDGRNGRCIYVP